MTRKYDPEDVIEFHEFLQAVVDFYEYFTPRQMECIRAFVKNDCNRWATAKKIGCATDTIDRALKKAQDWMSGDNK